MILEVKHIDNSEFTTRYHLWIQELIISETYKDLIAKIQVSRQLYKRYQISSLPKVPILEAAPHFMYSDQN